MYSFAFDKLLDRKHVEFDIPHIIDDSNVLHIIIIVYLHIFKLFVSALIHVNNVILYHEFLVKDQKIIKMYLVVKLPKESVEPNALFKTNLGNRDCKM